MPKNIIVKTGTKKTLNGHCAWFTIGNQTFSLEEVKTKKEAMFFAKMVNYALMGLYIEKNILHSKGRKNKNT